jgi:hypothetical protein
LTNGNGHLHSKEVDAFHAETVADDAHPAEASRADGIPMAQSVESILPTPGSPVAARCPYLKHAMADWLWPVEGICRARADGRVMVPPVPHYLHLCTTEDYRLCEAFRARAHALRRRAT